MNRKEAIDHLISLQCKVTEFYDSDAVKSDFIAKYGPDYEDFVIPAIIDTLTDIVSQIDSLRSQINYMSEGE